VRAHRVCAGGGHRTRAGTISWVPSMRLHRVRSEAWPAARTPACLRNTLRATPRCSLPPFLCVRARPLSHPRDAPVGVEDRIALGLLAPHRLVRERGRHRVERRLLHGRVPGGGGKEGGGGGRGLQREGIGPRTRAHRGPAGEAAHARPPRAREAGMRARRARETLSQREEGEKPSALEHAHAGDGHNDARGVRLGRRPLIPREPEAVAVLVGLEVPRPLHFWCGKGNVAIANFSTLRHTTKKTVLAHTVCPKNPDSPAAQDACTYSV
jgi:hypothetical protein